MMKSPSKSVSLYFIIVVIAFSCGNYFLKHKSPAIAQVSLAQKSSQNELPLPPSGEVTRYLTPPPEQPLARLNVLTDGNRNGSHYFIKLADWSTNKTILTLFLRAGLKTSIKVPLGIYKVKVAAGRHWYGNNKVFGPDTNYFLLVKLSGDSKMIFEVKDREIHGHEFILKNVQNGNLHRNPISPKSF